MSVVAELDRAAEAIRDRTPLRPELAVVLGSGLGAFAEELDDAVEIPYGEIPGWPASTAIGHAGTLVIGTLAGLPLFLLRGRAHLYEGHAPDRVVFGVRVLGRLGVRTLVLTNAAGGVNPAYGQGTLVLVSDHLNLQGSSPLAGPNVDALGPRFPDLTDAYDPELRARAHDAAAQHGIELHEGVYAAFLGPAYETPAEVRFCTRDRRRPRRHVDGARGAGRAPHGHPLPRALLRDEHGRRACPGQDRPRAGARGRRARAGKLTALLRELAAAPLRHAPHSYTCSR